MLSDQQRVCIETCLRTTSLATAIDALHRFFPQFNIVFKRLVDVDDRTGKKIDRFGGWDGKIITLNPEKGKDNPLEIVDTLAHEIVHALCSTTPDLKNLLLPPGAFDLNTDPHLPPERNKVKHFLKTMVGSADADDPDPRLVHLARFYGPSHSNPDHEFIDINLQAQMWVAKICAATLRFCGKMGAPDAAPTLTMVSLSRIYT